MSIVSRRAWVALAFAAALVAALGMTLLGGGPPLAGAHPGGDRHHGGGGGDERRVQALLRDMSLREKVGQMGQINLTSLQGDFGNPWDRGPLNPDKLKEVLDESQIGSLLSGGGAWPSSGNDGKAWATEVATLQQYAIAHQKHHIPMIYGVDAVHGHNNLSDATDFPHQIGLGATFDPGLTYRLGRRTGEVVRATGIHWDFAPVLDTERDLRWGRSYEPYSEEPLLNAALGSATIGGIQTPNAFGKVTATAKHFAGYSAPDSGKDRTDATISDAELNEIHLPPFRAGINAGVDTVMVNSGSVNGEPVHASHRMLTDILRGRLGFDGVVISDWQDVENLITKYHVAANMEDAVALAINAGLDMSMIPLNAPEFVTSMENAVAHGKITMARIDQSVARILRLKAKLGLFDNPYADPNTANQVVEDPADRPLARKAAQKTLVLLGNDGTLPLKPSVKQLLVTGPAADSPARQLGGWTVGWQGLPDPAPADVPVPEVTTLREGLEQVAPAGTHVNYVADSAAAVAAAPSSDAVVVAVGEGPYAETPGDTDRPALTADQAKLVDDLKAAGKPVVVVVIAGRPIEMDHQLDEANASLMAFLPGSEGGAAIADALFGGVNPSGRLPVSWPANGATYPIAANEPGSTGRRYAFGYGLSYTTFVTSGLRAPVTTRADRPMSLRVKLRNTGARAGDRTVLAIAEKLSGSAWAPRKLVAFTRTWLPPRSSRTVELTAPGGQLAPGDYRLDVDGSSQIVHVH